MITKISIENFKGIRDRIEIELQPITLLFGANSAGKSSILHALHYAAEVFERRNLDADQTVVGGDSVNLGGFASLVHGRDLNNTVWLRFDLSDEHELYESILAHRDMPAINEYLRIPELLDYDANALAGATNCAIEVGIKYSSRLDKPYLAIYRLYFIPDAEKLEEPSAPITERPFNLFAEVTSDPEGSRVELSYLDLSHPSWIAISAWDVRDPTDPSDESRELEPINQLFDDPDESVFAATLRYCQDCFRQIETSRPDLPDSSDTAPVAPILLFRGQNSALPRPGKPFQFALRDRYDGDLSQGEGTEEREERDRVFAVARELAEELSNVLSAPLEVLSDHLRQFRYLGPIRDVPKRDFKPVKSSDSTSASGRARWATGVGAWEELASDEDLIEETNQWLADKGRLDAGYEIQLKRYKELDLSDPLVVSLLTGRAFDDVDASQVNIDGLSSASRLVIVPIESELELEPVDVGIGISQVVPVVVSALVGNGGLQAIEQPELHLHPRLQAELGDLFVEANRTNLHRFIIETHSEHFILRLLRRIRETEKGAADDRQQLRTNDLAVYYVRQEDGCTTAFRIDVDVNGEFIQPWPDDFFEIDFYERFG